MNDRTTGQKPNSKVVDVGDGPQLFVDDELIESRRGLTFRVNSPTKTGVVLSGERIWEETRTSVSTVIEDGGRYRMWYVARPTPHPDGFANDPRGARLNFCYAESEDGVVWQKPNLSLFEYAGETDTNIVMPGVQGTVMIDEKAPEAERYKFFGITFGSALKHWPEHLSGAHTYRCFVCGSPDGLDWRRLADPCAIPYYTDTQNQMIYDSKRGVYAAYLRTLNGYGRAVARAETEDPAAAPWPAQYPRPWQEIFDDRYAHIDEETFPTVLSADDLDPPDTDLYNPGITVYKGYYLSFPSIYRHYPEPTIDRESDAYQGRGQGTGYSNDGPLEVQLAVSRDGVSFRRPDRTPYIPLGLVGSADGGTVYAGIGMLAKGDALWQYYTASDRTHGAESQGSRSSAVCRLEQMKDRFMGIEAGPLGGNLLTRPLVWTGARLFVNADCGAMGEVRFELAEPDGTALEGYRLEACDPVDLNSIERVVTWEGRDTLPDRKPLRLRARLDSAKLYAIRFGA